MSYDILIELHTLLNNLICMLGEMDLELQLREENLNCELLSLVAKVQDRFC